MLNEKQLLRMTEKLARYDSFRRGAGHLEQRIFKKVGALADTRMFETEERFYEIPADGNCRPVAVGDTWGKEKAFYWFSGTFTVPEEYAGVDLFFRPEIGGGESLLYVNGMEYGIFAKKFTPNVAGNHYCDRIGAFKAGETVRVDMETYAGHNVHGTQPFEDWRRQSFPRTVAAFDICVKDEPLYDAFFDLKVALSLFRSLPEDSFRRAELLNAFGEIHKVIWYDIDEAPEELFREGIAKMREILAPALQKKNAGSAPTAYLVGHSHMDTAWLWPMADTIKKCARTYSNQLNLMDRYPEHRFIQSSAFHGYMLLTHYPRLFERIAERVKEGRYEPNGGVWVECDCNLVSGESLIRQFLWGQRFTREHFNYTSDCFWLPDTFGYSQSLPQIMKGCGVDYFLTTKMSWNDTNPFPYDTFRWQGMDGTRVLTHLCSATADTTPEALNAQTVGDGKGSFPIKIKTVTDRRLVAYGHGDGGGGPQFEMLEQARREKDLDGCPKTEMTSVSDFMRGLEQSVHEPPVYARELYLELHRGTLTGQHEIKRNNRKAEKALHNAEFILVANAVRKGVPADGSDLHPIVNDILINQFHDILPGTSIPAVNELCREQVGAALRQLNSEFGIRNSELDGLTLINTLSFDRSDTIYLQLPEGKKIAGDYPQQVFTDLDGNQMTAVGGMKQRPLSAQSLKLDNSAFRIPHSAFSYDGTNLITPFAKITFAADGTISSFIDTACDRELCASAEAPEIDSYNFNTFLMAEDVSLGWDSWDIDADIQLKFTPVGELLSREVISNGPVELRIRSEWKISEKSTVIQDMIVCADSPLVTFDTVIDWHESHRFLKTAFDTTVFCDTARFEMQFGHVKRSTARSTSEEQAMFEVANHKFTDLSETRYGVSLLNDCKYGVSVKGGQMRLSLHKGGTRPHYKGDDGRHRCVYAFLPHAGGFAAENAVRAGYLVNYPTVATSEAAAFAPLAETDAPNVFIETVKPCEDAEHAYILRLYEAEGTAANAKLTFGHPVKKAEMTNMLEETAGEMPETLRFRPFEIKTVKVSY